MKRATIFEISKLLSISSSTVSRALKNHPDIANTTKARVLELAKKLDYEPNLFAVNLRKDDSREIAIIAPTLSGFYYDSFISAVEIGARKLGYSVIILLSGEDPQVEAQSLKTCRQRRVACIMVCVTSKTFETDIFKSIQSVNIPIIFFDKVPKIEDAISVCSDDYRAASLAANTLLARNKKRILSIFGDSNYSITQNRLHAYTAVLKGEPGVQNHVVHASNSLEAEEAVLKVFQNDQPEAIFCMSDEILIGVMKAIQILKLTMPNPISVIAISNGFYPKLYFPEITYVETSGFKLGELAVNTFNSITKGESLETKVVLEPHLIEGGSI